MSTVLSPDQSCYRTSTPPLQTTVSYGTTLSHGHMSTATSAKQQFKTPIQYTTKLQIHRVKTRAVFAIAPSTCVTFLLHRAAAAFLASIASGRALTSSIKSLLRRRNISRSILPGGIELRRLPKRKERAGKLLSVWQLVDSILLESRAMGAKYGRPAVRCSF